MNVSRIFKIAEKEISAFYNPIELSLTCISMFRKVALLEISKNFHLTGAEGLQSTGCNATKNKLLINFLKSLLKTLSSAIEFLFM